MSEQEYQLQRIQPTEAVDFDATYTNLIEFTQRKLNPDVDYGIIPGTQKKTLYKPGAEKIAFLFGLKPELETVKEIEDFDKGFFYYKVKCKLIHFHTGKYAGEAIRSCNSMEKKYAYGSVGLKWATEDQKANKVAIEKDSRGYDRLKYKKTPEEQADQVNTILAMAQKRAVVAAVAQATMATEIFDIDDDTKDDVKPTTAPTKEDNPDRINLQGKLAVVAEERGYTFKQIHAAIKKKHKVESFNDLTNGNIKDFIEWLELNYEAVGKGNKPKKLNVKKEKVEEPEITKEDDTDAIASITSPDAADIEEVYDDLQKQVRYCRNDKAHGKNKVKVPENAQNEWFCCQECEVEYWGDSDTANAKSKFDEMVKQGKLRKASQVKSTKKKEGLDL